MVDNAHLTTLIVFGVPIIFFGIIITVVSFTKSDKKQTVSPCSQKYEHRLIKGD